VNDVTIDVQVLADDGHKHVTRITGSAGIAITIASTDLSKFTMDPADAIGIMQAQPDMPSVSIRADNTMELALMLAGIISAVDEAAPRVLPIALALSRLMDSGHPLLKREYPEL
jgi:hypothetical protein